MKLRYFSAFLTIVSILSVLSPAVMAADGNNTAALATNAAPGSTTEELKEAKPPEASFTNSVKMELLKVGAGLWAGKFEVTQKEYQKVVGANPSQFQGDTFPVDSVTWDEAMDFCQRLTEMDVKAKSLPKGFYYTLPTEDEWRMLMADAGADPNSAVTSVSQARRAGPSPVGSLSANSLGLYDVRGNVMEFCLSDPTKAFRFLKGGSWQDFVEANLRPEFRWYCKPDERKNVFGFRCVLKIGSPQN